MPWRLFRPSRDGGITVPILCRRGVTHDGDNRDNSFDSRYFGCVERKRIVGQATAVAISSTARITVPALSALPDGAGPLRLALFLLRWLFRRFLFLRVALGFGGLLRAFENVFRGEDIEVMFYGSCDHCRLGADGAHDHQADKLPIEEMLVSRGSSRSWYCRGCRRSGVSE